jgi:hypothetical protein
MSVEAHAVDEDTRPCIDEDCAGVAEVERDGDIIYFECNVCFSTFGYQRIGEVTDDCAIGVPQDVRRIASGTAFDEAENLERNRAAFVENIGFGRPDGEAASG